jgi:hypothetical protein
VKIVCFDVLDSVCFDMLDSVCFDMLVSVCFDMLDSVCESKDFQMSYTLTSLLNLDFKPQFHRRENTCPDCDWVWSSKSHVYLKTALKFSSSYLYVSLESMAIGRQAHFCVYMNSTYYGMLKNLTTSPFLDRLILLQLP